MLHSVAQNFPIEPILNVNSSLYALMFVQLSRCVTQWSTAQLTKQAST